jgi:chromosome segregation ATPase
MSRELSEVEVLESEIERLEDEYYEVFDIRADMLESDDVDAYEYEISECCDDLEELENEIQNLREEVAWLQKD